MGAGRGAFPVFSPTYCHGDQIVVHYMCRLDNDITTKETKMNVKQVSTKQGFELTDDTIKALGLATKAGETSIDAWKRAADGLYADGVRLDMLVDTVSGFDAAVQKTVQDAIISNMRGERTAFLLNTESKYLTSGDDKDLKKLAANRLKEHMRAIRKYLKSHEESETRQPVARLTLSESVGRLLQEAMDILSKDQPAKLCDLKIADSIVAIRACKVQIAGFKILP
jgi:hypothetical protein